MALYKDGEIYRTYEEQIDHLTEAHREQLIINKNISNNLNELNIASNLGGYNLVRFSFEKQGTFFKVANKQITVNLVGNVGDFVEIMTNNPNDIPAYGFFSAEHTIDIAFAGDFIENYGTYTVKNVTSGQSNIETIGVVAFTGTSLLDYDANDVKKQVYVAAKELMFETDSAQLWLDCKAKVTPLLDKMVTGNGLSRYEIKRVATDKRATIKIVITLYCLEAVENFDVTLNITNNVVELA